MVAVKVTHTRTTGGAIDYDQGRAQIKNTGHVKIDSSLQQRPGPRAVQGTDILKARKSSTQRARHWML